MTKLFNRALLFKEWKASRFMIFIILLWVFIFKTLPIVVGIPMEEKNMRFNNYKTMSITSSGASQIDKVITENDKIAENVFKFVDLLLYGPVEIFDALMIVLLAILSFVQIFPERWGKNESVTYSLPVDRGKIMFTKIAIAIAAIFGVFILNGAIILTQYIHNADVLGKFIETSDILKWVIKSMFAYSAIYSLFMFVHAVCGNIFSGAILGPILMVYPLAFTSYFHVYFQDVIRLSFKFEKSVIIHAAYQNSDFLKGIWCFVESISLFMISGKYGDRRIYYGDLNIKEIPVLESFWGLNMGILISSLIMFSSLAIYFFHKNKLERKNWLIQFKGFRVLFVVCFTAGFSILGGALFIELFFPGNRDVGTPILPIIFTGVSFIVGYIIALKLISIGRRTRKYLNPFKKGAI